MLTMPPQNKKKSDGPLRFPLFRLPFIAIKTVFRVMENKDLFQMSLFSKRAKIGIRKSFGKNKSKIVFDFSHELKVLMKGKFEAHVSYFKDPEKNVTYKIGTSEFRLFQDGKNYWINPVNDSNEYKETFEKDLIQHYIETFNNPTVSLTIGEKTRVEFGLELFKLFKEQNLKTRSVKVVAPLTAEQYSEVLNLCSDTHWLSIHSKPPKEFEYSPSGPFTTRFVAFADSCEWVKLEDFMQCERLHVSGNSENSPITPEYLNAFFKNLVESDFKLKHLAVPFRSSGSFPLVVQGLSGKFKDETLYEATIKDRRISKIFLENSNLKMDII